MYALLLLLTTVVSCVLLAPGLQEKLKSVPFCKDDSNTDDTNNLVNLGDLISPATNSFQVDCANAVGYLAVYR